MLTQRRGDGGVVAGAVRDHEVTQTGEFVVEVGHLVELVPVSLFEFGEGQADVLVAMALDLGHAARTVADLAGLLRVLVIAAP
jgi:hypothetical protein